MSFTSIGSFNSGLWKGGATNTVSGITLVNFYTEAYFSWNPVKNATGYQVSVTGGAGGNSYTTVNTYQLFTGLVNGTSYTLNISAYVGAGYGPIKLVPFTTLKLPTYNTGNSGTVTRINSPNGVDSVWTFKDGNNIDFNLFSDICLNIIGVGAGSSSVLNPNTGTYNTGGGGGQVIYPPQFRVYNYYQKSPSIDSSYNFSITVGNYISPGSISLDVNSSFATTPNFNDPFYNVVYLSNGSAGNSVIYNGTDTTYGGNNSSNAGGGGAGTFGNGLSASSNIGGNGGPGIGFTINNVVYGPYGGGGGGYGSSQSGVGGIGGGGNGGINGNGLANTGGGAGGSNSNTIQNSGGSGAVVIVGTTSLLPSIVSGLSYGNVVGNATTNSYSVDISYNQSVNNVTGYCVQFSGNVKNTTSGLTGNSFVFNSPTILKNNYSGLNGGNAYTISAYTVGTYGNSVSSNIIIPQLTLPPTSLTQIYSKTTSNTIAFSFTAPTTPVSYYNATATDSSGVIFTKNNISSISTETAITGLSVATLYNINMYSVNNYGTSNSSNTVSYSTFDKIGTLNTYGLPWNSSVTCIALDISNNYVYAGGNFTHAGSNIIKATCIARWNTITNSWSALPNSNLSSSPFELLLVGKTLYISGDGFYVFDTSNNTWTNPTYGSYNSNYGFSAITYSNSSNTLYIGHGPDLLSYTTGNTINYLKTPGGTGGTGAPGPATMGMVLNDISKNLYIVYNNCNKPFAIYDINNNILTQYTSNYNFFTGICFDSSQNLYISGQRLNINGNNYTDGICYFNTSTKTFSALVNGGGLQSNIYYRPKVLGVVNNKLIIGTIFDSNNNSPFCRLYDIKTQTMSTGVNGVDANNDVKAFVYDKTTSYMYFGGQFTQAPGDSTSKYISSLSYFFPPTNLTAVSTSTSTITISYTEPYSSVSTYTVNAVPTPSGNTVTQTYNAPASSYVITGLVSGTTYNITLTATNSINNYGISNTITYGTTPLSPSGLSAIYNNVTNNTLISYNSVPSANNYYISISPYNPNIGNTLATLTSDNSFNTTSNSLTFKGLIINTSYSISVFASNSYGNSSSSSTSYTAIIGLTISGGTYTVGNTTISLVNYIYYILSATSASYTVSCNNVIGNIVNVLSVGGGGGGGYGSATINNITYIGGGGGGGGVVDTNLTISSPISVSIGTGGSGGNGTVFPSKGNNTTIGAITAYGGGAGGSGNTSNGSNGSSAASSGGSGGGGYASGTYPNGAATNSNGAAANTNNNNKAYSGGGSYSNAYYSIFCGGGGGGAGGVGSSATNATQVGGGSGYTYNLTGNTVSRGGSGGAWNSSTIGANGTNFGDGGGGGSYRGYNGGNGANGVVILSVATSLNTNDFTFRIKGTNSTIPAYDTTGNYAISRNNTGVNMTNDDIRGYVFNYFSNYSCLYVSANTPTNSTKTFWIRSYNPNFGSGSVFSSANYPVAFNGTSYLNATIYNTTAPILTSTYAQTYTWVFYAITTTSTTILLYINGNPNPTASYSSMTNWSGDTGPIYFGSTGNTYQGLMDDMRLYSRTLSIAEIVAIYNGA